MLRLFLLLMLLPAASLQAHAPHAHGVGELDLAFEAGLLSMSLRLPGDTVVGFERTPADAAERAAIADARAMLGEGDWFELASNIVCRSTKAHVHSPGDVTGGHAGVNDHAAAHGHGPGHGHAHDHVEAPVNSPVHDTHHGTNHEDWSLSFEFDCGSDTRIGMIDFGGLFQRLPRLERLRVQWIDDRGQHAATLTPAAPQLMLAN